MYMYIYVCFHNVLKQFSGHLHSFIRGRGVKIAYGKEKKTSPERKEMHGKKLAIK